MAKNNPLHNIRITSQWIDGTVMVAVDRKHTFHTYQIRSMDTEQRLLDVLPKQPDAFDIWMDALQLSFYF